MVILLTLLARAEMELRFHFETAASTIPTFNETIQIR